MASVWTSDGSVWEAAASSERVGYEAWSQQLPGVELQQLPFELELG